MTRFKTLDRNEQNLLDDAQLDAIVGGTFEIPDRLKLAATPVGGWTFKDVFAKPTLGTYH
jgi:hypothetical protein